MAPAGMPEAVIGLDVGKSSRWACVTTRDGEVLPSAPIANREGDPDSLFARFPGALVVVDQSRNTVSCHFAKNASLDGVPGFSPVIRHSFEMTLNR